MTYAIPRAGKVRIRNVHDQLPPQLKRCVDLAQEKGSSSWLSVLPLEEHGFYLHKGEFRDALCLRYGWNLGSTPQTCNCGAQFSVDHAMICHMGGFPTIRHNELRDITATLLTEVCHNVTTEPTLQPLSGETFDARSTNTMPEWTSVQEDSGMRHRMHSLMYVFFTQTHPVTVPQRPLQPTGDTSKPRSGNMGNASEK